MIYFDTSAVVKLVSLEKETRTLQAWMKRHASTPFFSSQLLRIELLRAVARTIPARLDRAREVLQGFALLAIDDAVVEAAESLHPPVLRSLDAIHLATALTLHRHVTAFVAYDRSLGRAARSLGLNVVSPQVRGASE